jgi:hypothetical protein
MSNMRMKRNPRRALIAVPAIALAIATGCAFASHQTSSQATVASSERVHVEFAQLLRRDVPNWRPPPDRHPPTQGGQGGGRRGGNGGNNGKGGNSGSGGSGKAGPKKTFLNNEKPTVVANVRLVSLTRRV